MIKQVSHPVTGVGAADLNLALHVAYELHAPVTQRVARAPEVAAPQMMGLRTSTARPHRRKVPLNRLTAVHG
ncbi:hypothetical protein ABZ614_28875 [Streptomyces sp. NPDC013178]|uniref:hypothetical protein n=1 Tax=unclassified Streptomyces TaxID=2593676 RepID=UPI0033E8C69B